MVKFMLSFVLLSAALFRITSADEDTLMETCPTACNGIWKLLREKKSELPECSKEFMHPYLEDDQEWLNCDNLKDFLMAGWKKGEDMYNNEGISGILELQDCVRSVSEFLVTERNINQIDKFVSKRCYEKFKSILIYFIDVTGVLD